GMMRPRRRAHRPREGEADGKCAASSPPLGRRGSAARPVRDRPGAVPALAATIEWAQAMEELGYDSFWLRDHPARAPEDPFTYLAAIAAVTRRSRLGTLVACVQFRRPVLLARVAADVDRLSNGRLVLGLGAGWDRTEFAQMGLPLPSPRDRLDALEE